MVFLPAARPASSAGSRVAVYDLHSRSAAVPAAAAFAIDVAALVGDHDRVLELDESALGMRQRGLDRDHHAGLERPLGVVVVIGHRAGGGQPRRLVAHQPHAVGEEVHVVVVLGLAHQRVGRRVDLAAHGAGLDRLHRGALDGLDLGQHILELGVGLAVDRHAAEVADIAVIVAARVEREDVALVPLLLRRRTVEAGARGDQAIVEGQAAIGLFPPQRLGELPLGGSRTVVGDHRQHGIDHVLRGDAQLLELLRGLDRAQPLEHEQRVHDLAVGKCPAQRRPGIDRQERELGADPPRFHARAADVIDRLLDRVDRARRIGVRLRHPERVVLLLKALETVTEIGRLLRGALGIDQNRQIAAQSHRIHGFEEVGAVAAEQILHVVLRGRDQHVDAGVVHQAVEPIGVERNGGASGGLLDDVEHEQGSLCARHGVPCVAMPGTPGAGYCSRALA